MRALLGSPRARVVSATLALLLFGFGIWHLGGGVYIAAKAEVAQILLSQAFEKTLATGEPQKPWPWADTWPAAKIIFPGREIIVLDKTSGQALAFGPGLMPNLAKIGAPGTALITAHNDTHFAFLENVRAGERFQVLNGDGKMLTFEITGLEIVDTRKPFGLENTGHPHLVLSTCFPFHTLARDTPYRFLVTAALVAN